MSASKRIHVALILDKSSSMYGTKDHTISGFNEQVAQIKLNAKEAPYETTITLITFNGEVYEHLLAAPLDQLDEADPAFYQCEGSTAMRDAIGYTIKKLSEIAGPDDDFLITTISDGDENTSKHFSPEALKEEIDGRQATNHWTFLYMGCSASSLQKVSTDTGIPINNMANWSNGTAGASKRAMTGTANVIGAYMTRKSAAPNEAIISGLCAAGEDQFMDYTSSVEGTATRMADAVAQEAAAHQVASSNLNLAGFAPRMARGAVRSRSMVKSLTGAESLAMADMAIGAVAQSGDMSVMAGVVEDRPEDLQLRVGTSKVFAEATKATW